MFPVYGLAEATLAVTFPEPGSPIKAQNVNYDLLTKENKVSLEQSQELAKSIVSCGKPLTGTEIIIKNEQDKILSESNVGEIFIKGPSIAHNYYQQAGHLNDHWLATGDLGFLYEGELYIVGRKKDIIIVNGRNIAANDIENRACENPHLKLGKTVAFSFNDQNNNEQVRLVAEVGLTKENLRHEVKLELCEALRSLVALRPENISLVPPLLIKKTTSGKIKRYYIKKMYLLGKVNNWEENYYILFLRSQILLSWLKIKFSIKNKVKSVLGIKEKNSENRYQHGTK